MVGSTRAFGVLLVALMAAGLPLVALPGQASAATVPVAEGLVLGLEQGGTVTASDGTVSAWLDSSGRGNDLTGAGGPGLTTTPTGASAVAFDGVDDKLDRVSALSGLPSGASARTVFLVAKYDGFGYGGFAWGEPRCNKTFGTVVNPKGKLTVQGWCSSNDYVSTETGTGGGWLSQSVVVSGGEMRHYRDGTLKATVVHSHNTSGSRIVLGAEIDSAPYVDMDVAAVLVYDRALGDAERQTVEDYLQVTYVTGQPVENEAPAAGDDVTTVPPGGTVAIDVLANDRDPEGRLDPSSVSVVSGPAHGSATAAADGTVTYTHDGSATSSDSFTYTVADYDGAVSSPATVTVTVGEVVPVRDGLVMHLESDAGVDAPNGVVTGWADSSGHGNGLTAVGGPGLATTPTGASAVSFDGIDDKLERTSGLSALPAGKADRTVILVAKYRGFGYGGFAWGHPKCNRTFGTVAHKNGKLMVQGWCASNDFVTDAPGTGAGWLTHAAVLSTGELRQYRDGTLLGTATHNFNTSLARVVMGAELDSAPYVQMDVAAALVYNRALSTIEREQVEDYLQVKYTVGVPGENEPPVATNDAATVTLGDSVTLDVLANDRDAEGSLDPTSVALVGESAHGTAATSPDGTITYTHDGSKAISDEFSYTVSDTSGATSNIATVSIVVNDFAEQRVVEGLVQPTSMTFLPDGRLLVLEKPGRIVITDPSQSPAPVETYMTVPKVKDGGELGLIDIALDPDFASNGHFYVYVSVGTKWRIARYTHEENAGGTTSRGSVTSEFMVWENPNPWDSCCHFGGGLDIGPDGHIYLTTGEEFNAAQAQDLTLADGKVIRVARDGSVPSDNPFVDGPGGNLDSIWAYGLRNPFRASWDAVSGRLFIGEVGGNDDSTSTEDIHLGRKGANYGWPDCEGMCADPAYDDPIHTYPHAGQGASVTGGIVYRGTLFPEPMRGAYFYGDYVRGFLRYLTFDTAGNVTGDFEFAANTGAIVAIDQGPDGALYVANIADGTVARFVYRVANSAPTITSATATPTSGAAPLAVDFSGSATDADGDPLTYTWAFGDGTSAQGTAVQHVYQAEGTYRAVLRVSDGKDTASSTAIQIIVGTQEPPVASITSPADGAMFRAGQTIIFEGTGSDPDEVLDGGDLSWTVAFLHNEHSHPVLGPFSGTGGSLEIPVSGHDYSSNTRYKIELTVTDSTGLSDTTSVLVYPEKVNVSFDSTVPAGSEISIDDIPRPAPFVLDTLIGFQHIVEAPSSVCSADVLYQFVSWSNGGARRQTLTVPETDVSLTANYEVAGACIS